MAALALSLALTREGRQNCVRFAYRGPQVDRLHVLELERNVVCMEADGSGGLNWTRAAGAMIDHGHASKLPPVCAHQDGHFQCSFGPLGREPTRSFKRPLSGDCRDVANLNALQLILTSLCAT